RSQPRLRQPTDGALEVDAADALGGIVFGEQCSRGYFYVSWVAEEGLAIGEGELRRLDEDVHVVSRVVGECAHIAGLGHVEELQERWALAPEAATVQDRVPERRGGGRLYLDGELVQ